jgi:hypothetical protein
MTSLALVLALRLLADSATVPTPDDDAASARVEIWGGVTAVPAGPSSTLVSAYSPPLLLDGDFISHGGQTLTIDRALATGVAGGINLFPAPHAGVQIVIDRASAGVSGTNGPYTIALQYTSRQPPNDLPQIVNLNQSVAWPATAGSITRLTVAFNAVARIGAPDRVSVTLSGGPTVSRLSGAVQPLGYTTFHLGGHSVLFADAYRIAMAIDPTRAIGFNAGGDLSVAVGDHIAIVAGYRFFGGSDVDVATTPAAILNPEEVSLAQSLGEVASGLGLVKARLSQTESRLLVGVKVGVARSRRR